MGETIKSLLALGLIVFTLAAGCFWIENQPDAMTWVARACFSIADVVCLVSLLMLQMRRDLAPDFLRKQFKTYFNSNGLCFAVRSDASDGVARIVMSFQNQFSRDCCGVIGLRPSRKFLLNREAIDSVMIPFECPGGAFGSTEVKISVPAHLQGKTVSFDVGASVEFPDGKGQRLRFNDGVFLRSDARQKDSVRTTLMVAGLATGRIVYFSPATTKIALPTNVSAIPQEPIDAKMEIHWVPEQTNGTESC